MALKYRCKDCFKIQEKALTCSTCFGDVVFIQEKKRENTMGKKKAIQFLRSQQYIAQKFQKNTRVFDSYKNVIDLIQKGIPSEDQNSLF